MANSPFPGMDPYLEASWGDIHHSLITYARDQIQSQLPSDLRARTEERISVGATEPPVYLIPDVQVVEEARRLRRGRNGGGVALAERESSTAKNRQAVTVGIRRRTNDRGIH